MKKINKLLTLLLALVILFSTSIIAKADDGVIKGNLGSGITYSFDTTKGELKIDGNGVIGSVDYEFDPINDDTLFVADDCFNVFTELSTDSLYTKYPWLNSKYQRNRLIFGDGITGVSTNAFYCFKQVYFGSSFDMTKKVYNELVDENVEGSFFAIYDIAEKYEVSPDNKYMTAVNDVLVSKDKTVLIKVPANKTFKKSVYYVPSGIKTVRENAIGYFDDEFKFGTKVDNIVFPKSVEKIGLNHIDCKRVFVLNPKCKIEKFSFDGYEFYFDHDCMVYKAGLKKFSGSEKNREEYYFAPLTYKNTRYYAIPKDRYSYTGKAISPKPIVLESNGKILKNKADYTLKYSKGRKNVGKYSITVKPKNGNKKAVKLSFNVVPSIVKIKSYKKKGTTATLKWKKHKVQTSGFQIQYSTNYEYDKPKTITIKGKKATSKKIKNLKKNKEYFIRIRAYKTVKGKKYYSYWSERFPG